MTTYPAALEQFHVTTYQNNLGLIAQQMTNLLLPTVTVMSGTGEVMAASHMVKPVKAQREELRSRRNPENPAEGVRRWLHKLPAIESGQVLDREDDFRMALDPTSTLLSDHIAAVQREVQATILGVSEHTGSGRWLVTGRGILGTATEGKTPTSTVSMPGSQTIAHGGVGLTLTKLRQAIKMLRKREFGMSDTDQIYAGISPDEADDLIGIAAAATGSLNAFTIEQLRSGKPTDLMGITWIMSNLMPHTAATGDPVRIVPMWTKRNIVVGEWQGIKGNMWELPDQKRLPYMFVNAVYDATRIQDYGVVSIQCQQAA